MAHFHEYDVVRVKQLIRTNRHYDGNEGVKRPPHIDDCGTIVHIPPKSSTWCIVECSDKDGLTIWLADFTFDELELVEAVI